MKLYFFCLLLLICSCKKNTGSISNVHQLPKDFTQFYDKFHDDSLYQMEHIIFPLEGMPASEGKLTDPDFKWMKEDRQIHKPFTDPNGDYTRELFAMDSSIVIEKIRLKNNEFGMERRFAKSNDEWYLIYYAAMNRLVKNNSIDSNME